MLGLTESNAGERYATDDNQLVIVIIAAISLLWIVT